MACSDCYNGCSEIISDKCVKYTGVNVPAFDIKKGDSLSWVEQALISYLAAAINGSGITITIDEEDYCELVTQYLQECSTVTALDLFKALVKAACNIQTQIDAVNQTLTTLNADYNIDCLSDVTNASDTHDVVQSIIDKLCSIDTTLTALALDVDTNYVKISELNGYIAEYIASTASATRYSSRMVPYAIQAYYGSLSFFDATGAGLTGTEWEDIYLCNGQNSTPDLRGYTLVGAISGVPGGALGSTVNPGSSAFNPNYSLGTPQGANSTILTTAQIPTHNHTVTDPGHTHVLAVNQTITGGSELTVDNYLANVLDDAANGDYTLVNSTSGTPNVGKVNEEETGISLADAGGGEAHSNIQPVIPVYYIIYIP